MDKVKLSSSRSGYLSFAASEIAADEIAAKNWPPLQRADILNRRLAFRRFQFTPPRNSTYTVYECEEDTEFSRIQFSAWYRYRGIERCVDRVRVQSKGQTITTLSAAFVPNE